MHHHFDHMWKCFKKKELQQIYISLALRAFALSLVGLFIPIYLHLEIGYTLQETLFFYLMYTILFAIFSPISALFAKNFGAKHAVLFSLPFYILYLLILFSLKSFKIPLVLVSIFPAVAVSFYWMGMHLIFHHSSHHKRRGEECGKRRAMMVLGGIISPFIGGILIIVLGFKILFLIASAILLLSGAILFLSKEEHPKYDFSLRAVLNKEHWKNSLFFISRGAGVAANDFLWPLFIFAILGSYLSLGIVGTILAGVSGILVWFVGKYSDHQNKHRILRWITPFESLSWFLKAFVNTSSHVFGATIFGAITSGIYSAPVAALEYDKAPKDAAGYFVSREIFLCLGRALMITFALMVGLKVALILQGFLNFSAFLF